MGSKDLVKDMFTRRFTRDGDGYIFRTRPWAPGYAFSEEEYEGLLREFMFRKRLVHWASLIFILAGTALVALFAPGSRSEIYSIILLLTGIVPSGFFVSYLSNSPARSIDGRPIVAPGLSKEDGTRLDLQQLSWRRLGLALPAAAFCAAIAYLSRAQHSGQMVIYVSGAVYLLLIFAITAIRKLRAMRPRDHV